MFQQMLQVSNGGSEMDNYSTNETKIGTWVDGKDIFRRAYHFKGSLGGTETIIDSEISTVYVDSVIKLGGTLRYTNGYTVQIGKFWKETDYNAITILPNTGLRLESPVYADIVQYDIIIEYTKA